MCFENEVEKGADEEDDEEPEAGSELRPPCWVHHLGYGTDV
jgi:hypothetical protein